MKTKIGVFLATVVAVACPIAFTQGNPASSAKPASAPAAAPAAKSLSTGGGTYATASEQCKSMVTAKKFAEARKSCTSAVTLAGKLPPKQWRERSSAYSLRGRAELGANDADDAAQDFKMAVEIDEKNLKPEDMALAIDYANLALAQFTLQDLENLNFADQNFQKASESLEVNILNDPAKKDEYQRALKGILVNYAKVKRALGQEGLALAMEQQANSIQVR